MPSEPLVIPYSEIEVPVTMFTPPAAIVSDVMGSVGPIKLADILNPDAVALFSITESAEIVFVVLDV